MSVFKSRFVFQTKNLEDKIIERFFQTTQYPLSNFAQFELSALHGVDNCRQLKQTGKSFGRVEIIVHVVVGCVHECRYFFI